MAEYYLKIEGVEGEARRTEHVGEVYIESMSLSHYCEQQPHENRVQHQNCLSLNLACQAASVRLMSAAAADQKFKQVALTMYSHPGPNQQRLRYVFSNVRILNYHTSGASHGDTLGMDSMTLGFSKYEVEHSRVQDDGTFGQVVRGGYDFVAKEKVGDPAKY
jgi:type VI protein secretion system component Hcp